MWASVFESYVILDTTKTSTVPVTPSIVFESYVILDTTKTDYDLERPEG